MTIAQFICRPFAVTQTTESCAARYEAANRTYKRSGSMPKRRLESPQCVGCRVGAAHADGKVVKQWEPGVPVERLRRSA